MKRKKNPRIRKAMLERGLKQNDLAELLGLNLSELSVMLKYELAREEQDEIIRRIKNDDRPEAYAG